MLLVDKLLLFIICNLIDWFWMKLESLASELFGFWLKNIQLCALLAVESMDKLFSRNVDVRLASPSRFSTTLLGKVS